MPSFLTIVLGIIALIELAFIIAVVAAVWDHSKVFTNRSKEKNDA